jgi:hypothetical protein
MKRTSYAMVLAVLLATGCFGGGDSATVPLRDMPAAPAPQAPAQERANAGEFASLAAMRKPMENEFVQADKADQCPMVNLTTLQGQATELQPGRAGYVTIVVVWSMDTRQGKAALMVVSDLARQYGNLGVNALGIVEMTDMARSASEFAGQMQVRMPLFYDNLKQSALRELAGAAGASDRTAFPAIFLIDRHLRLRFYRPGFRFAMIAKMEGDKKVNQWMEDMPQDETVEHYVKQILNEQW